MPDTLTGFPYTPGGGRIMAARNVSGVDIQFLLLPTWDYVATSAGVVTDPYDPGDVVNAAPFEWQGVHHLPGGRLWITGASLFCGVQVIGDYTLMLFSGSVAIQTPGNLLTLPPTDGEKALGMGAIAFSPDNAIPQGSSVIQYPADNFKPFQCRPTGTSIYGHLKTNTGLTLTGATSDAIKINLQMELR